MIASNAVTSAAYVVSINRPTVEFGVPIGGPSLVAAPDGEVIHESTAPLSIVDARARRGRGARLGYPAVPRVALRRLRASVAAIAARGTPAAGPRD